MSTTIAKQVVDEAMDAYVDWCELCLAVQDAYDRWMRAPLSERAAAFLDYTVALDHEERASLEYRRLVQVPIP